MMPVTTAQTETAAIASHNSPVIRQALRGVVLQQVNEYAGTFAAEFAVLACQIIVYKLAAKFLGTIGFSEYAIARRTISLLQPAIMLGIAVGLPRYIAMAEGEGDDPRARRFFGAAAQCVSFAVAVVIISLSIWPQWFAYLFFGQRDYGYLVPPLALILAGLSAHVLAYSYLRGRMAISKANMLNLANLGFVPVLAFIFFRQSAAGVLWALGAGWTVVALAALCLTPISSAACDVRVESKELLAYGLQRVPGDFALMGLLAFPALLAAHSSGIEHAGYVAFGISITNMVAAMFAPVGVILLPKMSRNLGLCNFGEIRKEVALIGWSTAGLSLALVAIAEACARPAIQLYLGANFLPAIVPVRIVLLAAVPLALYYALRSAIDAFHRKAINTVNLGIAFVFFVFLCGLFLLTSGIRDGVLWSFVASASLLAILTCLEVRRILQKGAALSLEIKNLPGSMEAF
ncbi:MAG: lipopolysaccharide biosynthesis protein [Candidatus Acidiferrales bacterium]